MDRNHQARRRLLALLVGVTLIGAAGVSANLFIWGGVPVNVHVSDEDLGPGEETKVTFDIQEQTDGEVELIYSDDSGKQLWKQAFDNPPLKVWNNGEKLAFKLKTKSSFEFTDEFRVSIMLRIEANDYPDKKAHIDIKQP